MIRLRLYIQVINAVFVAHLFQLSYDSYQLKLVEISHTGHWKHTGWLIHCFNSTHTNPDCSLYTPAQTYTQTIIHINICILISVHVYKVKSLQQWCLKNQLNSALTLESSHVARDEKLEAGTGRLNKVLDVSPGCHLVLLLHLFIAASQVLGRAHLKIWT